LQSPYGAFLFARRLFLVAGDLALLGVAIPLRGFSFCKFRAVFFRRTFPQIVAIPLRGFSFCKGAVSVQPPPTLFTIAIPLRGFSFCKRCSPRDRSIRPLVQLQSPYGAFLFARVGIGGENAHRFYKVAIPLRGFSFCKVEAFFLYHDLTGNVAIPLRGFSFCKTTRRHFGHGTQPGCVAIPLRGFSFCKKELSGGEPFSTNNQLQSPYGAFLFARATSALAQLRTTCLLQSPYGAFLFASAILEGLEELQA